MLSLTKNYLSGFKEIYNYKHNSQITNDIAILKIFSYLITLAIAIYTATSLHGRLKKGPVTKDEGIADKANQVLGTAANDQPSPKKNEETPPILPIASPAAIHPDDLSLAPKLPRLYIRAGESLVPQNVKNSLIASKLFASIELAGKDQTIVDKDAIVINCIHLSRSESFSADAGTVPSLVFQNGHNFSKTDKHFVWVQANAMSVSNYSQDLIDALKEHLKFKALLANDSTPLSVTLPKLYIRVNSSLRSCFQENLEYRLRKTNLFGSIKIVDDEEQIEDHNAIIIDAHNDADRVQNVDKPMIFIGMNVQTIENENVVGIEIKRNSSGTLQPVNQYIDKFITLLSKHVKTRDSQALPTTPEAQLSSSTPLEAPTSTAVASSSKIKPIEVSSAPKLPKLYIRVESEFSTCLSGNFENSLKETGLFSNIQIVDINEKIDDQNVVILDAIGGGSRLATVSKPTIYFCEASGTAQQAAHMKNIIAVNVKRNSYGKYQSTTPYNDEVITLLKKHIQDKANQT